MLLTSKLPEELVHMELGNAAIVALLGYAVVFLGLILLMVVTFILGRIFIAKANRASAKAKSDISAPQDGVVASVNVQKGASVQGEDVLVTLN